MDVSDIIGNKRNCFGQSMEMDPMYEGTYAGIRKNAQNIMSESGSFAPPRKNNS